MRIRTYTFKIDCPLAPTKAGEARKLTTFVYGVKTIGEAKGRFDIKAARHQGARGSKAKILKSLKIHRIPKPVM